MRRYFAGVLTALTVVLGSAAAAQDHPVVVELYTSAGCSSCPPADAMLTKLAQRDGVIALALHVDYWDYIGWKDEFGSPDHTERQRAYARAGGHRSIYTPQMIIGGTDQVVGNKPMDVVDLVNAQSAQKSTVDLDIQRNGRQIEISATLDGGSRQPMIVQLVRYEPKAVVKITRGENAGRTIEYTNIVTQWEQIDTWNGVRPLKIDAKAPGAGPVVVIVQAAGPGPILAAARLR